MTTMRGGRPSRAPHRDLALGGPDQMRQQDGVGQRTDTTRHRGDGRRDLDRRGEVHVTDDPSVDDVDADVDDDRARLEHRSGHEAGMAGRHDDDVTACDVASEIARPRVADGDRRILLDEQERSGHPDHRRPADDDGVASLDPDPGTAKDLHGSVGGRRQEPVVAQPQEPGVERVDAVDVLGRIDRVDDGPQPDRRRERHLDDHPVDRRVLVELADRRGHPCLGRLTLQFHEAGIDADLRAAPQDPLEVDRRGRVFAHDDDAEARWAPARRAECGDVLGDRDADLVGDRPALESRAPPGSVKVPPGPVPGSGRAARRSRRSPVRRRPAVPRHGRAHRPGGPSPR